MSRSACLRLSTHHLFYNPTALHTNAIFPRTFRDIAVSRAPHMAVSKYLLILSLSLWAPATESWMCFLKQNRSRVSSSLTSWTASSSSHDGQAEDCCNICPACCSLLSPWLTAFVFEVYAWLMREFARGLKRVYLWRYIGYFTEPFETF